MRLSIENLDQMTPGEERTFWTVFEAELAHDDGQAAKDHLAAGRPIYFCEADTPEGLVIKQHPDGRRELVCFDRAGERIVQAAA